jgi:hypothetical protein
MNSTTKKTLEDYAHADNHLTVKYSLYICTKDRNDKELEQSLIDNFLDQAMKSICQKMGGCNLRDGKGIFYNSENDKIIQEGNHIISVNCTKEQSELYESDLIEIQIENCKLLNQHSATIEKNNEMFFICAPPDSDDSDSDSDFDHESLQDLLNSGIDSNIFLDNR